MKTVTILSYRIGTRKYVGSTFDESKKNGSAMVHIRGWDHDTRIEVQFVMGDSDVWIVSKAAARSSIDWVWPWWRFSANRKLRYLKKYKEEKQLFLEQKDGEITR